MTGSIADFNLEMMEDLLVQRDTLVQELEESAEKERQQSRREILMDNLNQVNKALGLEEAVQDPLWVHWEAQLAQGIEPDLDMTLEDLESRR